MKKTLILITRLHAPGMNPEPALYFKKNELHELHVLNSQLAKVQTVEKLADYAKLQTALAETCDSRLVLIAGHSLTKMSKNDVGAFFKAMLPDNERVSSAVLAAHVGVNWPSRKLRSEMLDFFVGEGGSWELKDIPELQSIYDQNHFLPYSTSNPAELEKTICVLLTKYKSADKSNEQALNGLKQHIEHCWQAIHRQPNYSKH